MFRLLKSSPASSFSSINKNQLSNNFIITSYNNNNNNNNNNNSNNNNNNINNNKNYITFNYSTKYGRGVLLGNTKRKNSDERRIKVNHISKEQIENLMEYQNKQKAKIQKSDKKELLKSEFGLFDDEADDIIESNEKNEDYEDEDDHFDKDDFEEDEQFEEDEEDEDDNDYKRAIKNKKKEIENKNNKNNKLYISEKYFFSNDQSKDDEFIKRSLGSGKNYSEENSNGDWKEIDEKDMRDEDGKNPFKEKVGVQELKKQELKKKGITEIDGHYYSHDTLIPNKFQSYFLTPDQPVTRSEKKYFAKLDALQAAKKDKLVSKRGFKFVNDGEYDDGPQQTIVQTRLGSRILEVLRESPLFESYSRNFNDNELTKYNSQQDNDELVGELKKFRNQPIENNNNNNNNNYNSNSSNKEEENYFEDQDNDEEFKDYFGDKSKSIFSNPNNDKLGMDRVDPIISNADIELTRAVMSSDLRWVKIFWKRRNHTNINENSMNSKRHLKTIDQMIKDDDLVQIESVQDSYLKKIIENTETNSAKQLIYDLHSINDKSTPGNLQIISNTLNSKIISKVSSINNNNNNNDEKLFDPFNFGNNNLHRIDDKKVELEISLNNDSINEKLDKINELKREKILLKRYSNKDYNEEDDEKEIEQLLKSTPTPNKIEIPYDVEALVDNSDIIGPARHREIEIKRRKKYRSLFFEITDRDISHRLVKIKSKVRWIIGKRVKSKYVPDILFVKDEDEIKEETTKDLIENFITPELRQLFVDKLKTEKERKRKLKSKYSSLFDIDNSNTTTNTDTNTNITDKKNNLNEEKVKGLLKDNDEDQVDLIGILKEFPELLSDKVVQKYLRMERKKSRDLKQEQEEQEEKDQEEEEEKGEENNKIIEDNTKQMFKDFNKDL